MRIFIITYKRNKKKWFEGTSIQYPLLANFRYSRTIAVNWGPNSFTLFVPQITKNRSGLKTNNINVLIIEQGNLLIESSSIPDDIFSCFSVKESNHEHTRAQQGRI